MRMNIKCSLAVGKFEQKQNIRSRSIVQQQKSIAIPVQKEGGQGARDSIPYVGLDFF